MGVLVIISEVDSGPFEAGEVIDVLDDRQDPGDLISSNKGNNKGLYSFIYVDASKEDQEIIDLTERVTELNNGEPSYLGRKHKIDTDSIPKRQKDPRDKSDVMSLVDLRVHKKDHNFKKPEKEKGEKEEKRGKVNK